MTAIATASADLRARLAVRLVFVILGGTQGGWMARIPAIRDQVGVDTARWGLRSSSSAAGDLVAIVLITVLIGRVSTRLLALVAASVTCSTRRCWPGLRPSRPWCWA